MKNIQELIDRYKEQTKSSVMGFLSWGARSFYAINSDVPVNLNMDSNGFILNEVGLVEEFELNPDANIYIYFADKEHKQQISWEKFNKLHGLDEDKYEKFAEENPNRARLTYRFPLTEYYPHPWYPEREITGFEVIRILPFYKLGEFITYQSYEYTQADMLNHPEFFKPHYKIEL